MTFGQVMRHAILFLHHILVLCRNVTSVNLFAARYRQISRKQGYHMSSKLHILQYQTQRFSGGLLYETDGDARRLA